MIVAECCNCFEVPVTVTEYVPGGVPGFLGALLPPPPQETVVAAKQASRAQDAMASPNFRPPFFVTKAAAAEVRNRPSHKTISNGLPGFFRRATGNMEEGAVVEIVSVEVAVPEPGVTVAGENVQVACDGSPEQASET